MRDLLAVTCRKTTRVAADLLQRAGKPGVVARELYSRRVGQHFSLARNPGLDQTAEEQADVADDDECEAEPERRREEIELIFDRNKGAIFALYNRALRVNSVLEGKLLLQLAIEPDGSVSACEVVSSELGDVELE